jgi:Protein of unknown function (DUF3309)
LATCWFNIHLRTSAKFEADAGTNVMSIGTILIIILIIFLLGGFSGRFGGYGYGYGHVA